MSDKDSNDEKIEKAAKKDEAKPGDFDPETGKYTDDGIDALVDQIKNRSKKKGDDLDEDEDPPPTKKDDDTKMVPISRLNEVIEERNRLRQQVTAPVAPVAKKDAPPTVEELRTQLSSKRKEWQKAIFDNDADKADSLLSEMDKLETTIDDVRLSETANATRVQSADDVRYDNLLEQMLTEYPIIDKSSPDFDQNVVTEIYDMREAYIARGLSQTDALKKARDYILKPLATNKKVKDVKKERTDSSKRSLADALSRQPANVSDLGASSDAVNNDYGIDIKRLTPEQFEKLPEDVKADLRGDALKEHHMGRN